MKLFLLLLLFSHHILFPQPSVSMITFQNQKSFPFHQLQETENTVSTLLIPNHLLEDLKKKTKENGNSLVRYLSRLLKKYRTFTHSGMIPPPKKIKTEFQEEGLNLKRLSFRVRNSDWIELGELALAFGKSRCWVFTFLLELDILGLREILSKSRLINAVPTKKNLELRVSWSLSRDLQDFARSYYVRV